MRTAFIRKMNDLAKEDKNVYLLVGDLGFSVVEDFEKGFPGRFYNVGIAEQTMAGVAAGLALSGKTVFTYSIATFATMRCFEQIRNDIAYHNLDVRIVGVGSGFSYNAYGVTHHSLSDIGIMRTLPNMKIISPGDPLEVEKTMEQSRLIKGPIYLRLGKKGEPILHPEDVDFKIGRGIIMKEGNDICLISHGTMLEESLEISKELESRNISVRLISMPTIKPLDKNLIIESCLKTKGIFVIEEHNIIGGLGSAVSEVLSESRLNKKIIFERLGVKDKFCEVAGDREYVRDITDISREKIIDKILSVIRE